MMFLSLLSDVELIVLLLLFFNVGRSDEGTMMIDDGIDSTAIDIGNRRVMADGTPRIVITQESYIQFIRSFGKKRSNKNSNANPELGSAVPFQYGSVPA